MIDDFTFDADLFPQIDSQDPDEKYLHSQDDYLTVLETLQRRFNYSKSIVPFVIYFLFVTGMRFGELIALTKSEIDEKRCRLYTYRRYNTTLKKFVPPKNKTSVRFVPLSREDMDLLVKLIHLQEETNKELGITNPEEMVFQHFAYKHTVPDIASVNKYLKGLLESL